MGYLRVLYARSPGVTRGGSRSLRSAHVVGRQGRVRVRTVAVGRRHGGTPAVTVDVVVVAVGEAYAMQAAGEGVVGRDIPCEGRVPHRGVEAEVLRCVVHASCAVKPYALQVERHVHFVARVGIVSEYPQFVVGRVDALHPHLVDEYVGLDFVIVAAVNHHLMLRVEVLHRACGLCVGKVAD